MPTANEITLSICRAGVAANGCIIASGIAARWRAGTEIGNNACVPTGR